MGKINFGGISINNFEPQKQIEIVFKKGLTSKKLILDRDGIHLPKRKIHIDINELLNEKPPVVAYVVRESDDTKSPVSLVINYFDGKKWCEFVNIKKPAREADEITMKLNERLATIHFS